MLSYSKLIVLAILFFCNFRTSLCHNNEFSWEGNSLVTHEFNDTNQSDKSKLFRVLDLSGGINYSQISFLNNYTQASNNLHAGYILGIGIYKPSGKRFEFTGRVNFLYCKTDIEFNETSSITLVKTEKFQWIDIPFYVKYNYRRHKISPNVFFGISLDYLISSRFRLTRHYSLNQSNIELNSSMIKMINITKHRERLNASFLTGFGIEYPLSGAKIYLNLEYKVGIFNIIDSKNKLSGNYLYPVFQYVDEGFTLNSLNILFGIKIPLIK